MRRKSTRASAKSSPEKPKEEKPTRKTRRHSKRHKPTSSESESDDEVSVSSTDNGNATAEKELWTVSVSQTEQSNNDIAKIKICLARPSPATPERTTERASKRLRNKPAAPLDAEGSPPPQLQPQIDEKPATRRSRRGRGASSPLKKEEPQPPQLQEIEQIEEKKGKGKSKGKHKSKIVEQTDPVVEQTAMQSEISENVQVTAQSPQNVDITDADNVDRDLNQIEDENSVNKCVVSPVVVEEHSLDNQDTNDNIVDACSNNDVSNNNVAIANRTPPADEVQAHNDIECASGGVEESCNKSVAETFFKFEDADVSMKEVTHFDINTSNNDSKLDETIAKEELEATKEEVEDKKVVIDEVKAIKEEEEETKLVVPESLNDMDVKATVECEEINLSTMKEEEDIKVEISQMVPELVAHESEEDNKPEAIINKQKLEKEVDVDTPKEDEKPEIPTCTKKEEISEVLKDNESSQDHAEISPKNEERMSPKNEERASSPVTKRASSPPTNITKEQPKSVERSDSRSDDSKSDTSSSDEDDDKESSPEPDKSKPPPKRRRISSRSSEPTTSALSLDEERSEKETTKRVDTSTPVPSKRVVGNMKDWGEGSTACLNTIIVTSETLREIYPSLVMLDESSVKLETSGRERAREQRDRDSVEERKRVRRESVDERVEPERDDSAVVAEPTDTNSIATHRKISIVDDEASSLRPPPSPAKHERASVLFISNLVRPFTVKQLRGLLERTGKIVPDRFWTDRIKSKCYVQYETEEEAEATRNAIHGVQWPVGNGKKLIIDYATPEDLDTARNPPAPAPPPKPVETAKENEDPVNKKLTREGTSSDRADIHARSTDRDAAGAEKRPRSPTDTADGDERHHNKRRHSQSKRSRSPVDDLKRKKREEPVQQRAMDDLFRKTEATPSVYWQPLSPEEIALKQQQRQERMEAHKRKMESQTHSSRTRRAPEHRQRGAGSSGPYRRRY